MSITGILDELGINLRGTYSRDGSYVIDLEDNSNAFGKVYSILDKNAEADDMEENTLLTVDNASMYYKYKGFMINIIADFRNDHYKVVINEV